ncbi:hypothetical protein LG943_10795 [Streptomonospora sp. S1-112]|uniref:Uncharacterized protein n=1 Tax=Streptomonospora mangrovi TaxID=2883123 RepID=A0A9X3SEC7_9ACTN|nr:hypothetical protein [Streptomonospora mangrovi]MDA0564807.1 hypothetical protein [Streptomonospora mangrovi]
MKGEGCTANEDGRHTWTAVAYGEDDIERVRRVVYDCPCGADRLEEHRY